MDIVYMDSLSLDGDTMPAKKGALVGFDGHKRVKGTMVHAAATEGQPPVSVVRSSGRIHEETGPISLTESISIGTGHRPRKGPKTAHTKHTTLLSRLRLDKKHDTRIPSNKTKSRRLSFLDRETYNAERFFGWRENGKIQTRYERMRS